MLTSLPPESDVHLGRVIVGRLLGLRVCRLVVALLRVLVRLGADGERQVERPASTHALTSSRCGRSSPPFPEARGVCHAIRCGIPGWWATRCVRCQRLGGRVHVDLVDVRAGLATSRPGHGVDARHPSDVDPRCTAGVKAVRPARPRKQVGSGVMPGMIRVLPARAP